MAYQHRPNPFNPLIVGAIAVIVALVVFLIFREAESTQQAGIKAPPAATNPATTPAPSPPASRPDPQGPGKL